MQPRTSPRWKLRETRSTVAGMHVNVNIEPSVVLYHGNWVAISTPCHIIIPDPGFSMSPKHSLAGTRWCLGI